jgi:hypothetical protein
MPYHGFQAHKQLHHTRLLAERQFIFNHLSSVRLSIIFTAPLHTVPSQTRPSSGLPMASLAFIMINMGKYIAVDIGGTRLRVAVYANDAIIPLRQERIATQGSGTPMERLIDLIRQLWPADQDVLAIGAAAPGPINPKTGVLYRTPNIPGWDNLPLQKTLEEAFDVPVAVGNDANMAALGEARFGAAPASAAASSSTITSSSAPEA